MWHKATEHTPACQSKASPWWPVATPHTSSTWASAPLSQGPPALPPAHPLGWHCPCSPDEDTKAPGEGRAEPHWPRHSVLCSDGSTAASPCPRPCPCAMRDPLSFATVFRLSVRNTPCPRLAQACLEIKGGVHPPGLWGRAQGREGYQSG